MSHLKRWSTKDFDEMSWHDVHVHGFRIIENAGNSGTAELILDIDYILEWQSNGPQFSFVVAQASLQFHEIFGLKFTLDYAQCGAGMCAFSLAGIERELIMHPAGHASYQWRLIVNWPVGEITFESPGFTQSLTGPSYTQASQSLAFAQRGAA